MKGKEGERKEGREWREGGERKGKEEREEREKGRREGGERERKGEREGKGGEREGKGGERREGKGGEREGKGGERREGKGGEREGRARAGEGRGCAYQRGGVDDHDVHLCIKEAGGEANVDSRLLLVPRQHPHFDPGHTQACDRLRHAVLKPVLDTRCTCWGDRRQTGMTLSACD